MGQCESERNKQAMKNEAAVIGVWVRFIRPLAYHFQSFHCRPDHIPLPEYRFFSLIRIIMHLGLVVHAGFFVGFHLLGIRELATFNVVSVTMFRLAIHFNERRQYYVSLVVGMSEILLHQSLAVYFIGLESQFHLYILLCTTMLFFLPNRPFFKTILLTICISDFVLVKYLVSELGPIYTVHPVVMAAIGVANMLCNGFCLGLFLNHFSNAMSETEKELVIAKRKSDALLLNILPRSIAKRLKETDGVIAEDFNSVTILFADIAGFTELSQKVAPKQLVQLLNTLFSAFDELTDKYGLEKIKTIGDAYMVAGGLPDRCNDHTHRMAKMALDMQSHLSTMQDVMGSKLQIRIGMHTGPVVAGVIGVKKFSYDLWGDSVNTASRLESHGVEGKIHVSADVRHVLVPYGCYHFEERGIVNMKGKGEMRTWFLS